MNQLTATRHVPLNKAENIEEFIQPASSIPDPDPVLISAYVPDAPPDIYFVPLTAAWPKLQNSQGQMVFGLV